MSRRAIWAPRHLETWNWREAMAEDQRSDALAFEVWSRPDAGRSRSDPHSSSDTNPIGWPLVSAWIGFTAAGLAAVVFALSMLYSQLASTVTGVVASPGPPLVLLAIVAGSGLVVGTAGLRIGSRRDPRSGEPGRRAEEPETSIAA